MKEHCFSTEGELMNRFSKYVGIYTSLFVFHVHAVSLNERKNCHYFVPTISYRSSEQSIIESVGVSQLDAKTKIDSVQ